MGSSPQGAAQEEDYESVGAVTREDRAGQAEDSETQSVWDVQAGPRDGPVAYDRGFDGRREAQEEEETQGAVQGSC